MFVLHSGQTGVERGAQRAAMQFGCRVAGFCTPNRRDELGRIPSDVERALTPCLETGPRAALDANLAIASALIVIVPVARLAPTYPGIATLLRSARARATPYHVVDERFDAAPLARWLSTIPKTSGSVRCLVTGPRETRWAEGARIGWRLVASVLNDHASGGGDVVIPA